MLTVFMNIPVYKGGITLTQLALEQHNTRFLNNERVNRMMTHTWISANPMNPYIEMLAHKKNPKTNLRDSFKVLKKKPIYFYLSPLGYQVCISVFFTVYVIYIIYWVYHQVPANNMTHKYDGLGLYNERMKWDEAIIWTMTVGFIYTEFDQYLDSGRDYFTVSGGTNLWDIIMCLIWMFLITARFSMYFGFPDTTEDFNSIASASKRRLISDPIESTIVDDENEQKVQSLWILSDEIYIPPDSIVCDPGYNFTSERDQQLIDWICGYGESQLSQSRRLQDIDPYSSNNCTVFDIRNSSHPQYAWDNDTCLNWNANMSYGTECKVQLESACNPEADSVLLAYYNGLWAIQLAQLTTRMLLHWEYVGGFFGVLLRIIAAMLIELLNFGLIVIIVVVGFFFAIWFLFAVDTAPSSSGSISNLWDVSIFFFKLLFGGGNVGTIDSWYDNYRVFAQVIVMVFAIIGIRMFMSLLIALMSGAMNRVRQQAKA